MLAEIDGGRLSRTSAAVDDETSTWPPCPEAAIRAARWTSGADVAFLGDERGCPCAGRCEPGSGPALEPLRDCVRRAERARSRREGEEEGVTLGVDLDSALPRAGIAHDEAVLQERLGVVPRRQSRRAAASSRRCR